MSTPPKSQITASIITSLPCETPIGKTANTAPSRDQPRSPLDRLLAMRAAQAIAVEMKIMLRSLRVWRCLVFAPAHAIVGGGAPSAEGVGRSIVTIVGSRGNFCTGALIAPQTGVDGGALRAARATYKIVEYGADQQPQLRGREKRRPFTRGSTCRR